MKFFILIFLVILVFGFAVGQGDISPQGLAGLIGGMIPGAGRDVGKGLGGLKGGGGSGGVAGGKPPKWSWKTVSNR